MNSKVTLLMCWDQVQTMTDDRKKKKKLQINLRVALKILQKIKLRSNLHLGRYEPIFKTQKPWQRQHMAPMNMSTAEYNK